MGLDEFIKISLFSVVDGHGGTQCADFLKLELEKELKKQLEDPINGIKTADSFK